MPNAIRQQLSQPAASSQAKPPAAAPAKPAAVSANPGAAIPKPVAAGGKPAAPSAKPVTPSAKPAVPSAKPLVAAARRDPFDPLVNKDRAASGVPAVLPPGKAGLVIATLNLDGIVRGPSGMIAIVSNPQQRVYFLHQGDQLYDGQVGTITMEAVAFHQTGRDPFGAVIARDVTRRLYPSPGEQP